ncbi:RHS repeat-associated core domain-containing protein [Desulfobulbus oralis]|uniref:RHS repeat-associated core domain-containing protein n=1 Tax=Desulfobulbus oralis TaxID=1986146 RepID=UPI002481E2EF|nr:RHS repeat-associated core domain-containing protein [Desulfobulbus oralis]
MVWQAAALPFGQTQLQLGTVHNNLRFPGQYFDAETGLHYNWNRYYDPETKRYILPDPIGLGEGLNLYAYAENDPVNRLYLWRLAECI